MDLYMLYYSSLRMHCVGNVVLNSCVYTVSSLSIYDCVTAMLKVHFTNYNLRSCGIYAYILSHATTIN